MNILCFSLMHVVIMPIHLRNRFWSIKQHVCATRTDPYLSMVVKCFEKLLEEILQTPSNPNVRRSMILWIRSLWLCAFT
jgi:hypothetical protein